MHIRNKCLQKNAMEKPLCLNRKRVKMVVGWRFRQRCNCYQHFMSVEEYGFLLQFCQDEKLCKNSIFHFVQMKNSSKTCFFACKHEKHFEILFFHFVKMQNASKAYFLFCTDQKLFKNMIFRLQTWKTLRNLVFSFWKDAKRFETSLFIL